MSRRKRSQGSTPRTARAALTARDFAAASLLTYRKRPGGPSYAHQFKTGTRVGVLGRYLVIGPVTVRGGEIR